MKELERIIPTIWINNQTELDHVLKIFNKHGIRKLRVNCTRCGALEYIDEIICFKKRWGEKFDLILDMPIPKKKVRIFYKWKGSEFRIQQGVIYPIFSKELLSVENENLYVEDEDFRNLLNIPLGELITIGENQSVVKMMGKEQGVVFVKGVYAGIVPYGKYITSTAMKFVECSQQWLEDYIKLIEKVPCYAIALSFVETAEEIKYIRNMIGKNIRIIAKIETLKGVENVEEIIKECDEIIIARGDLFINAGYKFFAKACNKLVLVCEKRRIVYHIATGIFESFRTDNALPSRSELCEVYNIFKYTNAGIILEHNKCRTEYQTENLFSIIRDMFEKY